METVIGHVEETGGRRRVGDDTEETCTRLKIVVSKVSRSVMGRILYYMHSILHPL